MSAPLIDSFSKTLAPCGGCGGIQQQTIDQLIEKRPMQFILQIVVDADGVPNAVTPEAVSKGTIIAANPKPPAQTSVGATRISSSQHKASTTLAVPSR